MNRLPFMSTVAAVVALTASTAYWALQLYKPEQRPIAAVAVQDTPPALVDAARGLFGGETAAAAVSSYKLVGVVASRNGRDSVAIVAANGDAPKAYPVGAEVAAGVTVKEVHARHVILLESGVSKRLDLPSDAGASTTTAAALPDVNRGAAPPQMPQPMPQQQAPQSPAPPPSATPLVTPPPGTPIGQPGQPAPVQTAPAQRTTTQ
ncbi:type II secretion system protein N [Pseudoduganella buxea]|uniref:Type II secretion system protein GspC N-terminal domain-containing protein n=1 Tax=Pseudoduganella buxea TaxID=1949069 RepID=A0A6I3SUU7_9BURK|nr:type II secretion system protein N [Pseudoduganella buxea]MTV52961.1 hypothetical protein [Pseudoduganella buxea]GGC08694.1 hypothetical protein GCM10011572_32800 [Pseudoduganella buxea]